MAKLMTSGGVALARELRRPASAPATAEELAARCPTFEAAEQLCVPKADRRSIGSV